MIGLTERQHLVDTHFDGWAPYWQLAYSAGDVQAVIYQERQARALALADSASLSRASRVLEVGCGAGSTAVLLARRGFSVDAVDTVTTMIHLARDLAARSGVADRVTASVGDVAALAFADGAFSLVVALGVIPWLPSVREPMLEIARVLEPGGYLIASADNRWRLNHLLDPRWFPPLAGVRARARDLLDRGRRGATPARVRNRTHSARELDGLLLAGGFRKLRGLTLGFGPFTFLGRPILTEEAGVRFHHLLQRRARRGFPILRASGAQHLVLAQKDHS